MLIAIISDTHGNSATFAKFAAWAKQNNIQEIIHCGDIGWADFAKKMSLALPESKLHLVIGNMDTDGDSIDNLAVSKEFSNLVFYGQTGQIELGGQKIAFTHFPAEAKKLAQTSQFNLVFYGHTHKPWEEKIGSCRLINPGNLTGQIFRSSFAVYDTNKNYLQLKIIDNL